MDSGGFMCHQCGRQGTDEKPVARFFQGESGWPHELQYMCAECLFTALLEGKLNIHYAALNHTLTGFEHVAGDHEWTCYTCRKIKDRVGMFGTRAYPDNLRYLCPDCLFNLVVDGTFRIWPVGLTTFKAEQEAAPSGPTATVNKESGAVSVDGITFRW